MTDSLTILVVCAANVCRSPLAATMLQRWASQKGLDGLVTVSSAGVLAEVAAPMCPQAGHWARVDPGAHGSRPLTAALVADADLILAAEREHRAAVARLDVRSGSRLFTLRQAGDLGVDLSSTIRAGSLPEGAGSLPAEPRARLAWLVGELDAGRYLLAGRPETDADITDTHGPAPHDPTFAQVTRAVDGLTGAMEACLEAPDLR